MITIKYLNLGYYGKNILEDTSIEICDQELTVLRGKSGSGKTTFLKFLFLDKDTSCNYVFDNLNINTLSKSKKQIIRRKYMFFINQNNQLIEHLTLLEHAILVTKIKGISFEQSYLIELLKNLDLHFSLDRYPKQLSFGQQSRFIIALGLLTNPKLFIIDEPEKGLDDNNIHKVIETLNFWVKRKKSKIIIVSHNHEIIKNADWLYKIEDKKLICIKEGNKEENNIVQNYDFCIYKKNYIFWYLKNYFIKFKKKYFIRASIGILVLFVILNLSLWFENFKNEFIVHNSSILNQEMIDDYPFEESDSFMRESYEVIENKKHYLNNCNFHFASKKNINNQFFNVILSRYEDNNRIKYPEIIFAKTKNILVLFKVLIICLYIILHILTTFKEFINRMNEFYILKNFGLNNIDLICIIMGGEFDFLLTLIALSIVI